MKRVLFYISTGIAIVVLFNIADILITDLNRLTDYGYGYLVGKIILLITSIGIAVLTRKRKNEKHSLQQKP
ncbi:hypothetical protein [Flagellimonas eckloniae]|uniref:Uncharacterized protein n=1 Tax=Flagellimonas eckloniae TaxID=346185 RepID=A0A0Q1BZG3_9FLAO|nr:hypothetical protein [Allomuricauda eckloniae]KQC30213.1 hypothetical protein AAY42_10240 [Allomuricauda eckloniae]